MSSESFLASSVSSLKNWKHFLLRYCLEDSTFAEWNPKPEIHVKFTSRNIMVVVN